MSPTVTLPRACPVRKLPHAISCLVSSGKKFLSAHSRLLVLSIIVFVASTSLSYCSASNASASYRLGSEDVITVNVLGHLDLSGEYYIPADGFVNLPVAGRMNVAGKTLDEFAQSVKESLSTRLIDPDVSVSLKTPRAQRVYVLGAVSRSGYYDAKPGWRITEAIAASGGISPAVELSHCSAIVLRASDGKRQTVSLSDVVTGSGGANLVIENGDVLTIDDGEMPIYVVGKVGKAGLFRVQREKSGIMEVLAMASGVLPDAALTNVTITHLSGVSEVVNIAPAIIDGKEAPRVKLESGDMISVPESKSRIAALGWVKTPGLYSFVDGREILLSDALALAGGIDNKRGGTDAIAIVRVENGKEQRLAVNYAKFLKTGDVTQNPKVKPGDVIYVPETGRVDWDFIARAAIAVGSLARL